MSTSLFYFDERYKGGIRTVLVSVEKKKKEDNEDLEELRMLALSAGAEILGVMTCARKVPDPKFFIGSGKTQELKDLLVSVNCETVIFNHELTPSQERNLEKKLNCKVITRTALILEIFAARARTKEGKLQVELAQLGYLETRLVRGWTHLERQRGGFGMRGGPGETQLESDRRLLKERVVTLKKELTIVEMQRNQGGQARNKNGIPVVSLVGYTNAGKSTLFNNVTNSDVYAADQLFATLDPTLRTINIPGVGKVIIADTVGFIRHLPHNLVAAFRATLRETREADLELLVVDSSDADMDLKINSVQNVLEEIGAGDVPTLMVYNKIDRLEGVIPHIENDSNGKPTSVSVSAKSGAGLELLYKAIASRLGIDRIRLTLRIPPHKALLRHKLFEIGAVEKEEYDEEGFCLLTVCHERSELAKVSSHLGGDLEKCCISPKDFSFKKAPWED